MKMLPIAGGIVFVFVVAFALYVRSVPPVKVTLPKINLQDLQAAQGIPEFMNIKTDPVIKKESPEEPKVQAAASDEKPPADETIEL